MSFGHLAQAKPSLEVSIVTGKDADVVLLPTNTVGTAIAAGDVVTLASAATTSEAAAFALVPGSVSGTAIGIALEASTGAGEIIRVCGGGYVEGGKANGGSALNHGDTLMAIAGGAVDLYANSAIDPPVGVALSDEDGDNNVTIYWYRKY